MHLTLQALSQDEDNGICTASIVGADGLAEDSWTLGQAWFQGWYVDFYVGFGFVGIAPLIDPDYAGQ